MRSYRFSERPDDMKSSHKTGVLYYT